MAPNLEVGGVLIGRAESPLRIEITDFQPIVLEKAAADGKFKITPDDRQKLEQARKVAESRPDGGAVIGYYRSHLREDLSLDEADLALFRAEFPKSTDVCLLIKPLSDSSTTAGFFFWDNGTIESGFSFNEFPLDVRRLRLEAMEQRLAMERPVETESRSAEPKAGKSRGVRLTAPLLAGAGVLMLGLGVGALALGMAVGYGGWNQKNVRWTHMEAAEADSGSTLGLRVETQNQDLRVTWNYRAPILRDGTAIGVLTIVDGDLPKREIRLSAEDLRTPGSIIYAPLSQSIQFRLEVQGATQRANECVLSIKAAPSRRRERERG